MTCLAVWSTVLTIFLQKNIENCKKLFLHSTQRHPGKNIRYEHEESMLYVSNWIEIMACCALPKEKKYVVSQLDKFYFLRHIFSFYFETITKRQNKFTVIGTPSHLSVLLEQGTYLNDLILRIFGKQSFEIFCHFKFQVE